MFNRPMTFSPQQPMQQQQFFRYDQFQPGGAPQQFPPTNNQFQQNTVQQAPQFVPQQFISDKQPPPIKINNEKFLNSETPRIFDKQFRVNPDPDAKRNPRSTGPTRRSPDSSSTSSK
ncbi:hypothetical protein COOONC_06128 [Cooperia oncophora]